MCPFCDYLSFEVFGEGFRKSFIKQVAKWNQKLQLFQKQKLQNSIIEIWYLDLHVPLSNRLKDIWQKKTIKLFSSEVWALLTPLLWGRMFIYISCWIWVCWDFKIFSSRRPEITRTFWEVCHNCQHKNRSFPSFSETVIFFFRDWIHTFLDKDYISTTIYELGSKFSGGS